MRATRSWGHRQRAHRAFTLVELLVVIGIISVLIALLMPTVARARHQAQLTTCMARLHDFSAALITYAVENRGYFPRHDITMGTGHNTQDVANRFYQIFRTQFRKPHETFFCPLARDEVVSKTFALGYATDLDSTNGFVMIGYGLWVPRSIGGAMTPPAPGTGFIVYDAGELSRGPIRIGEKLATRNPILCDLVLTTYMHWPPVIDDLSSDASGLVWRWTSGHQINGRLESANEAFADGHVERVPGAQVRPRYLGGKLGVDTWNWR